MAQPTEDKLVQLYRCHGPSGSPVCLYDFTPSIVIPDYFALTTETSLDDLIIEGYVDSFEIEKQ